MTKIGVFPYLGRQISPDLEPDRIYKVLRPEEELTRPETLESLKLLPLINDHTMIGNEPGMKPAEEVGVEGTSGTNVEVSHPLLTNDLKIFTENIKNAIDSGKKELSMGYRCRYDLTPGEYNGEAYDAIQRDIIFNHIALVDEGRCGSDVRVMDCSIAFDSLTEIIKNKENDMTQKGPKKKFAMDTDVDKRELIREVMAIAAKPNEDFEGGEEEKIETIAKKLEAMSYNNSESGGNDEEPEPAKEDPKKTEKGTDEEPPAGNTEALKEEIKEEIKEELKEALGDSETAMDSMVKMFAQRDNLISRIRPLIGDNANYSSMTHSQVVKYACDKLDLKPSQGGELSMLEGYLKAAEATKQVTVSLDSALRTECGASEVIQGYIKGEK